MVSHVKCDANTDNIDQGSSQFKNMNFDLIVNILDLN